MFEDGIGERLSAVGSGNEPLEVLKISNELSAVSAFEPALREQTQRLNDFRNEGFAHVRGIERLDARTSTVVVISDRARGVRLSELLAVVEREGIAVELNAALCLIRQLVTAVAALHEAAPESCHGAIGPERLIITPEGRLLIVEYVLGPALEQLHFSQERYWRELGIALPHTFGLPRFDLFADVTQIGAVALALLRGRRLSIDEYPGRIAEAVDEASTRTESGTLEPLPLLLRTWLRSALQLEPRHSFVSAVGAKKDLEIALSHASPDAERTALRNLITKYVAVVLADRANAPVASPVPARPEQPSSDVPVPSTPVLDAPHVPDAPHVLPLATVDLPAELAAAAPAVIPAPLMLEPEPPPAALPVTPPVMPIMSEFIAVPAATPVPTASKVPEVPVVVPAPVTPEPQTVAVDRLASLLPAERLAPAMAAPMRAVQVPAATVPAAAPMPAAPSAPTATLPEESVGPARPRWASPWLIATAASLIVATLGFTVWRVGRTSAAAPTTGTLTVGTNPDGVAVFVDGVSRGNTPLDVTLSAGDHVLELVSQGERRRIPVKLAAGSQVSQYFELARQPASDSGNLQIRSDPSNARVTVDGQPYGRTPTVVNGLMPGPHRVLLESDTDKVSEEVMIEAGATASLVVPMQRQPAGTVSGWIAVTAPAEVQIYENQRLLGTSRTDRIMLPIGRHQLEFVNEPLGYRSTRSVEVNGGQVAAVRPEWPRGSVALNALPWAEVFVDGERVGETPIGSASLPIGVHEVVFRHPELGERKASAIVTTGAPARLSVDMRTK